MPRGNRSTIKSAPNPKGMEQRTVEKELVTPSDEEVEAAAAEAAAAETEENTLFFPLIVEVFAGLIPGMEGYDAKKDRLMIGYQYGNTTIPSWWKGQGKIEEVTPYEFLTHPSTGMREGQNIAPHGTGFTDLSRGISDWADLPPLEIWQRGTWLSDAIWESNFELDEVKNTFIRPKIEKAMTAWPKTGVPIELYDFWITSGEGTTGNNLYRIYELPAEISKKGLPHHPRMWPKKFQEKMYQGLGSTPSGYVTGTKTTATTTPKTPTIPAGVRYRCVGCGHWFTLSDLSGHAQVCGKGEDADWAMMCHGDCGCTTLDQASSPKPGFPRVKTEAKIAEEAAAAVEHVESQIPVKGSEDTTVTL